MPPREYRVYVVKLRKGVLRSRRFRRENPRYRKGKPCVYVGYTSHTPEVRYHKHMTDRDVSSRWVRRYGKGLFHWAFENLPTYDSEDEAKAAEAAYAEELRARGWGAWQR